MASRLHAGCQGWKNVLRRLDYGIRRIQGRLGSPSDCSQVISVLQIQIHLWTLHGILQWTIHLLWLPVDSIVPQSSIQPRRLLDHEFPREVILMGRCQGMDKRQKFGRPFDIRGSSCIILLDRYLEISHHYTIHILEISWNIYGCYPVISWFYLKQCIYGIFLDIHSNLLVFWVFADLVYFDKMEVASWFLKPLIFGYVGLDNAI